MKRYPFKFLDAYTKEDTAIFFGRDEEIKALYQLVFQAPIVLLYGASGTGKTSLIQCGLASRFESHDWLNITIRRGSNINASFEKALTDAGGEQSGDEDLDWLHELGNSNVQIATSNKTVVTELLQRISIGALKPIYLIFDQFEELFVLGTKDEQDIFVNSIRAILSAEYPVKMIFSIREEYLGHLYHFENLVPQLTQKKLRIEAMGLDKVRQVIIGAANRNNNLTNINLKEGEEEVIPKTIFEIIKGDEKLPGIELPYLQVFLDKLYLNITKDETRVADAELSNEEIKKLGGIGDVLRNFLEEQVQRITKHLALSYGYVTSDTVWKILSPFVTLEGTKEPISKAALISRVPDIDSFLVGNAIEAFVNGRIVRYSEGTELYEVSHDALAQRIAAKRSDEDIAILEIQRLVRSQTTLRSDKIFFSEKQLKLIVPFMPKLKLSAEEKLLVDNSVQELSRQVFWNRFKITLISVFIACAIFIGVYLLYRTLRLEKDNAETSTELEKEKDASKHLSAKIENLRQDSINLQIETKRIKRLNDSVISSFQKNVLKNNRFLARVNAAIVKSQAKFADLQRTMYLNKINDVITYIKSNSYRNFDVKKYYNLIDNTADKKQAQEYTAIIRDSIDASDLLSDKVRLLFFLTNATGNDDLINEISNVMLSATTSIIEVNTIYEIGYQTDYNTSPLLSKLRFQVWEHVLEGHRQDTSGKLSDETCLILLPKIRYYDSSENKVIVPNQLIAPYYVCYFKNIENYFEALKMAEEVISFPENQNEKVYRLDDLSSLNKLVFCRKLSEMIVKKELSTVQLKDVIRLLPNTIYALISNEWNSYRQFNVPSTTDNVSWENWRKEHPDIIKMNSPTNLDLFKSKVREYWQEHKITY